MAIRSLIGLLALSEKPCCRLPISFFDLFSTHKFHLLARYVQSAFWTILFIGLLNLRPFYLLYEVSGWGNSPCGASSCTRDDDIRLQNAIPFAVYNPAGWFPRGDFKQFNAQGTDRYIFCNYQDQCRWADYHQNFHIRSYERLAGGCQLNFKDEVPHEHGFMSKRIQDYPDRGRGVLNGWAPCKLVGQSFPCRGVMQQNEATRDHQIGVGNVTVDFHSAPGQAQINLETFEAVTDSGLKHFYGKKVCSVCSLYQNALKKLTPFDPSGVPDFRDRSTPCVPNPDESINPWCFICPGEGGGFGSPFYKFNTETILKKHLEHIFIWCLLLTIWPILNVVLIFLFVSRNSLVGYRLVDEEENEEPILGEEAETPGELRQLNTLLS